MEREGESARVRRSRRETRVAFNENDQRQFLDTFVEKIISMCFFFN